MAVVTPTNKYRPGLKLHGRNSVFAGVVIPPPEPTPTTLSVPPPLPGIGAAVDNEGGMTVTGVISATAGTYTVRVGPAGGLTLAVTDPIVYSGIEGQGNDIIVGTDGSFTFIVPPLPIGGPYAITFIDAADAVIFTEPLITVVAHTYHRKRWDFRRLFPPRWRTGPRGAVQVTFPQV